MCYPVTCNRCGKTTWDGCGEHVDEVMGSVPKPQQCVCDSSPASATESQPAPSDRG